MTNQSTADDRLDGWEAISVYLGWHVRTVIRWEKQKGLPVHRVPGGKRQPVFAYRHEIDRWFEESGGAGLMASSTPAQREQDAASKLPAALSLKRRIKRPVIYAVAAASILSASVLGIAWRLSSQPAIQITGVTQLTSDGTAKWTLVTDGKQLYFNEDVGDKEILSRMAVSGGPILRMALPLPNPQPEDISTDGKFLLVISDEGHEDEHPLWIVPTTGEPPYQIAGLKCHTAAWSPAGDWIAFASGEAIYVASPEGGHIRLLSHLGGIPRSLQWSSDGKHLLYFLQSLPTGDAFLWQMDLDGNLNAERVTPLRTAGDRCCKVGLLARDANGYFSVEKGSTENRLLQLRPQPWWRTGSFQTYSLSTHLDKIGGLAADAGARKIFVINGENQQGELVRYDLSTRSFTMLLPEAFATFVDFTKNREFATYVKSQNASLWVSRADGSDARQLSPAGMGVQLPRWSPDGKWIAFMGQLPHRPFRIFVLPAAGGVFKEASRGDDSQGAPTWSPDGRFLVYGNVFCQEGGTCAIHRIDLASGKVITLPNSQGLSTARLSPDGRHIAALNAVERELLVFDRGSQRWRKLADGINGNDVSWSSDSRYVYTKSSMSGPTEILRVAVGGGTVETVLNLDSFSKSVGQLDTWFSLTPDNAVLLNRWLNTSEIYALNY
jgi:Tol biopolymer transport system component